MAWLLYAVGLGGVIWAGVLLAPWRTWSTAEQIDVSAGALGTPLDDLTVLIPARDEADVIGGSLRALGRQGDKLKVIVIDDQSQDATREIALQAGLPNLRVVEGSPLPDRWRGKVWALEQGLSEVQTPYVVLLDADIELAPGFLATLLTHMKKQSLGLCSVMVALDLQSFAAKLLNPAFVFFFKLLYPFRLSNQPGHWVAASAGGCVVVETSYLRKIGGFEAIHHALIDDCALARAVKRAGASTWIGLTNCAHSRRPNEHFSAIWSTVTRSAFTQLHYSVWWLFVCSVLMLGAFVAPVAGVVFGTTVLKAIAAASLVIMFSTYQPVLRFYRLSACWAVALPLIGVLYLLMTWHSAVLHWFGRGASWKRRRYRQ